MNKTSKGFSIVELLLVVVIIGILASISVAGLLASKRSANEGSTISTLRILHSAQMTYSTSYGVGEFAGDIGAGSLASFQTLRSYNLIDDVVSTGAKSGYKYVGGREAASATTPAQFFFSSIPISADPFTRTGDHRFGIATDGVIRQDATIAGHYLGVAETMTAPSIGN
jgi:prepilin-type N-terminal cleavage/methylation domain-containing protein